MLNFGPATIDCDKIADLLARSLTPRAIIRDLDLLRPIYRQLASYGHFGRDALDLTWEKTNKADALREAVGL